MFPRGAQEVVHEHLRLDLLLDIEWRGVDDEIAPILLVLATPDELRIEVGVARIPDLLWMLLLLFQHGLVLGRRNVLPLGLAVLERLDRLASGPGCRFLGHD
jgi:hypothetical protein